jgi:electron transport complex protein RnfC
MLLKSTFKLGGIHAPENKQLSAHKQIVTLPIPEQVYINLNQQLGRRPIVTVEKKQEVSVGDVIAKADGDFSAFIHSPVSGTIKKIDTQLSALGTNEETIIIDVNAEKTIEDEKKFSIKQDVDIDSISPESLLEQIKNAGIVGQGGAAFPIHLKLAPPKDKKIDILLLNGAECEPYLTSDHQLMLEKAEEILTGSRIIARILKVNEVIIGIEENKPDAIDLFLKLLEKPEYKSFKVASLQTKYPQGGEKQLIYAATGREVPSGKLPFEVGVVVQNVATAFAVYEAVFFNKPLIDRITSITGFVKNPGNYRIKIGTTFDFALTQAGGPVDEERVRSVINGGPMMGKSVRQLDVSIMKGTGGIVVLSDKEFYYDEEGPCIRCGKCIDVCPMGLMPVNLANDTIARNGKLLANSLDCIECGSCSYICPTNRKLVHWIRFGKTIYREWKTKEEKIQKTA